jgi:hypothetical protein
MRLCRGVGEESFWWAVREVECVEEVAGRTGSSRRRCRYRDVIWGLEGGMLRLI